MTVRTLLVLVGGALGGCFAPSYHDGHLHCGGGGGGCPDGYHCAVDATCWRDGNDPPRPPVHLTAGGGAGPLLTTGSNQVTLSIGQPLGGSAVPASTDAHSMQLGVLRDATEH
jgi:hypothetical protein